MSTNLNPTASKQKKRTVRQKPIALAVAGLPVTEKKISHVDPAQTIHVNSIQIKTESPTTPPPKPLVPPRAPKKTQPSDAPASDVFLGYSDTSGHFIKFYDMPAMLEHTRHRIAYLCDLVNTTMTHIEKHNSALRQFEKQ